MKRDIQKLTNSEFDVLIIGGGIFGACAAWDATLRGLNVAIIEKFDFASGVSANSFKIVHGGMRYLQHFDIKRLRASCHERSSFLRVAPHLVQPLPILVPTYGHGKSGKAFLATGLYLYDFLTMDRNKGITDRQRHIPLTKLLNKHETLKEFPDLDQDGLTGSVIFCDGRMYNPTRLVLSFAQSADQHGACVANYVEAREPIYTDGKVSGIKAFDNISQKDILIRAKTVLNASGPWSEILFSDNEKIKQPGITYSRDACFVIKKQLNEKLTIAVQGKTKDPDAVLSRPARHLFVSPWRNYTLIGVWHVVTDMHPEKIQVTRDELTNFIDEINWAYPHLNISLDDVLMWNAGLVPFGENEPGSENLSYGKRSHIIDHKLTDDIEGLVSIIGVRYTMGRGDSAKAVDLIQKKLGNPVKRSPTDYTPVFGGDIDSFDKLVSKISEQLPEMSSDVWSAIGHNYGTNADRIIDLAKEKPMLSKPFVNSTVLKAEVINSIKYEMAQNLSDIIFRRTDLATAGNPGEEVLTECAALAGSEFNWTTEQIEKEIAIVKGSFPTLN
ncbi:MAG: glycerol-3-phosphate dehydrogenase/oxidase [Gammaproteobacteria bacterium]|nr:glycerol-3-phosphate dehydrogenase/oxidase [Gammaproteobacteria bacterium]